MRFTGQCPCLPENHDFHLLFKHVFPLEDRCVRHSFAQNIEDNPFFQNKYISYMFMEFIEFHRFS